MCGCIAYKNREIWEKEKLAYGEHQNLFGYVQFEMLIGPLSGDV